MTGLLFDHDYGVGSKEVEQIEITTTILYFSKDELKEFKKLCKNGMRKVYGSEYQTKGNLSDFLLTELRKYEDNNG